MRAIPDNTQPFLTKSGERGVGLGKWRTEKIESSKSDGWGSPCMRLCITVHFVFVSTPSALSPGSLSNYSWEVNKYLVSCQTQEHSLNWKLFLRNFSFTFPTHFFAAPRSTWSPSSSPLLTVTLHCQAPTRGTLTNIECPVQRSGDKQTMKMVTVTHVSGIRRGVEMSNWHFSRSEGRNEYQHPTYSH